MIVLVQWSIFPFYRTALYFSTKPISSNATATEHIKQTHTHTHTLDSLIVYNPPHREACLHDQSGQITIIPKPEF